MTARNAIRTVSALLLAAMLLGCEDSLADRPARTTVSIDEARVMQEVLIDTFWDRDGDMYWYFGPTGRFVFATSDEDGTLHRGMLPADFPEGRHRGYEGDWRIRKDGLVLTNIRPARFWTPGTRPTEDDDRTSEHACTVGIQWTGEKQNGLHRRLVIDGRSYSIVSTRAGGVALRNLEQMKRHLTHGSFGMWTFDEQGTFIAALQGAARGDTLSQLGEDVTRITGKWSIAHEPPDDLDLVFSLNKNKSQLVLSDVRIEGGTGDGRVIDELVVPLGWVDGKLRIEIDDNIYMRALSQ